MKRFGSSGLLLLLLSGLIWPLFVITANLQSVNQEIVDLNNQISEKRSAISDLEKNIDKVKKDIAKKQTEVNSLKNQLSILDQQINAVQLTIELTEDKLEALGLEIQSLQINIGTKEEAIDRQKVIMGELIRSLARRNEENYVQVLASYDNFSQFYNQVQYLERMEQDLGKNMKSIRLAKEDLEYKKTETEKRKAEVQVLELELQEQKDDLDEQSANKERLLLQTQSSERTYQTLLSNLRKEYQQTESEISSIERLMRSKLTEKQRLELLQGADASVLSWPTPSHYITAYFHDPDYPYRHIFEHNAIDIRAAQGTQIRASASGYVAQARRCTRSSCYAYVMIIHNDGISTLYGHLSRIDVAIDQFVGRGDVIGLSGGRPGTVGAGPFVTGPHLHFEVRKDGIPVDPTKYLTR